MKNNSRTKGKGKKVGYRTPSMFRTVVKGSKNLPNNNRKNKKA